MDIHLSDAPLKNISAECGAFRNNSCPKVNSSASFTSRMVAAMAVIHAGPSCCHWVRRLRQICHWYFHGPRVSERASSGRWFPNLITVPLAVSTYKWTGLVMSERRSICEGLYQGLKEPLLNLSPFQRQHSPQGCHRGA